MKGIAAGDSARLRKIRIDAACLGNDIPDKFVILNHIKPPMEKDSFLEGQIGQYDKVLQENIEAALPGIIKDILHIDAVKMEELPDSLQHTKERRPMAAWAAVAVPTITAQVYLVKAAGKLTAVIVPIDILKQPVTRFYTISSHYINKPGKQVWYSYKITGKYGEDCERNIYIVCPILTG